MGCVCAKPKPQSNKNIKRAENQGVKANRSDSPSQEKNNAKEELHTNKEETQMDLLQKKEIYIDEYEEEEVNRQEEFEQKDRALLAKYSQVMDRGKKIKLEIENQKEKPKLNQGSEKRLKELLNLTQMIESNLEQSELIQGKDIVIVLGATGVGKSTTINYLLGKKMIWSKFQNQAKNYVYEVEGITVAKGEQEAAKIGTKPMESQTKTINVYNVQHPKDERELVLCDTPGLLDSQGSIVDIANQVGIVKSLQYAKSIRVLLLIGYKNLVSVEGKGKLIKEVIDLYSKLIKDYEESQESVLIGFTHLNSDTTLQQINNSLKAMTDSVSDDDKVSQFLHISIQSIEKKNKLFTLIKPLISDKRQNLIDSLFNIQEIPQERVNQYFTYALAQNTKNEFELILQSYQKDISNLFQREEYDQITNRLSVLKKLNEQLEFTIVKKCYAESVQSVINLDLVKQTQSLLQRITSLQEDMVQILLQNIIKVSNYLCWTDQIRHEYQEINDCIISYNDFIDILSSALEECFQSIEKTENYKVTIQDLLKLYYIYHCSEIEDTFKTNAKTLRIFHKGQVKIKSIYTNNFYSAACFSISKRVIALLEQMDALVQSNEEVNVNDLESNLSKLKDLYEQQVGEHLQLNSKLIYQEQVRKWCDFIQQKKTVFEIDYNKYDLVLKAIDQMKIAYHFLAQISGSQRLMNDHFPQFKTIQKDTTQKLVQQAIMLFNKAITQKKLVQMEKPIQCAMEIMNISDDVRNKLQEASQALFVHLGSIVQKFDMKFSSCSSQIKNCLIPKYETTNKDLFKSTTEDEFQIVKKKINSIQKIFKKITMKYFQSFKFFQNSVTKSKIALEIFIEEVMKFTQDQVNEFRNPTGILNGLFTLKQSSILLKDYTNKKFDETAFQEMISLICNNINTKFSLITKMVSNIQIPNNIDDSYRNIEEQIKNLNHLLQFIQNLSNYILNFEDKNQSTIESLIQLVTNCQNGFAQQLISKLKMNMYDFEHQKLPSDAMRQKIILDQLQKLKEYNYSYSLLGIDLYEHVLEKSISEQSRLIKEISDYLSDNPSLPDEFNQESAQKNLTLIRQAGVLYLTHFIGRLDNPADTLQSELTMKQKGLDKKVKSMVKQSDYDQILEYMRTMSEDNESYKSIKKILKEKVKMLFDQIVKSFTKRNILDDICINKIKQDIRNLEQSKVKLAQIKFKNFRIEQFFPQITQHLAAFQQKQVKRFEEKIATQKIEKASRCLMVVCRVVQNFQSYIRPEDNQLPDKMINQMKLCLRQIENQIDIKNKQQTTQILQVLQVLVQNQHQYKDEHHLILQKVNKQILEQAAIFVNTKIDQQNEEVSVQAIAETLKGEYQYLLMYTLDNYNQHYLAFFQPILKRIQDEMLDVRNMFTQRKITNILNLINGSKSSIVQKEVCNQYNNLCDTFFDLLQNRNYNGTQELLKFLSQVADGIRSFSYNSLKQKYFELQVCIEQEFNRLQTSTVQSLNQIVFERESDGIYDIVQFYQFNSLMAQFNFQYVKHDQFNTQSCQVFDKIQKQLKQSVSLLQYTVFNNTVKLIDFIEQTRVSLNDQQINVIQIYKKYLADMQSTHSHVSSFNDLTKLVNDGCWTIQQVISDLLNAKKNEIINGINSLLIQKNYKETSRILRQVEEFSKKIQESSVNMNTSDIMKVVFRKYEEKAIEAQRRSKDKYDSKLFALIEDLSEMEKYFKEIIVQISNYNASEEIINQIKLSIAQLTKQIYSQNFEDESDVREFVASIINIRQIAFEIGQVHEFTLEQISELITTKFQQFTPQFISDVSSKLRQDKLGLLIIQENSKNFEGLLNKMIEELSKNQFSLEYVNNNIKGEKFIASEFSVQYKYYEECWKNLLSKWHQGDLKAETILQKTKSLFKKFCSSYQVDYLNQKQITWSASQKQDLSIMLAHLSTFWSIVNCQRREDSFRKLHPVQVSTVMRLLSIDTTTTQMPIENHLVQVKTGEGKSIILGITSCFLGLLGFYVDCCCYSNYLSQRDFQSFSHIFQQLEIDNVIKYNTFEKQFEDIINDPEDMRQVGLDLIDNKLQKKVQIQRQGSLGSQPKRRILLIDEVDFFFGEDFIGRTYPVALYYNNQDVIDILKYIWQNRAVHIDKFKQTPVYKKLFQNNPNLVPWQAFIDERIKMMYEDVNNLEGHRYLTYTPSGKSKTIICYKSLDGISFNTVKGYKTAFAYIQEWEKKNITEDVMNENLSIIINVGCFSFAQIPQEYQLVLGVSGTLEDMSEYQKNLTKNLFNIRKLTISPSIYGQSKFSFKKEKDVVVKENKFLYHLEIQSQIENTMKQNRSVIVFFESKRALDIFKNEFKTQYDYQVLSEETNFKGHTIVKAGSMSMITLATKPFGRGCDFISTDPELDKNGGIHIIQTFLSEDLAEETQIKGRTARQAQCGSYSLVVNREDLVLNFNLNASVKNFSYEFLHQLRQTTQKNKEKSLSIKLEETSQSHKESMRLKQILLNYTPSNNQEIQEILIKFNRVTDRTENKTNMYNFYSDLAGKIGIYENNFEYDEYNNPKNVGLGSDNSYNDLSLLIGLFYPEEGLDEDINHLLIPTLRKKGFKVCEVVVTEQEFIAKLPQFDQAWVVSGYKFHSHRMESRFQDAIEYHLKQQKGLMIWADNNPYIVHANLILQRIPVGYYNRQPIFIKLDGSDYGDQVLKAGNYFETQQFGPHLITTGINNLHEGITICYPQVLSNTPKDNFGHLNIIGLSSASKPCFFVLSGTEDRGRIVFDCGFTKLMRDQWNTAGTVTYVTNCYAWLYWKERFVQNL
ncbi:hypothetical protein ABPG74_011632 [Tetrahymena malaccensis]